MGMSGNPDIDQYGQQCPLSVTFEPWTLRVGSKPKAKTQTLNRLNNFPAATTNLQLKKEEMYHARKNQN